MTASMPCPSCGIAIEPQETPDGAHLACPFCGHFLARLQAGNTAMTLSPCPFCNGDAELRESTDGAFAVCPSCGMRGPNAESLEVAAEAWNGIRRGEEGPRLAPCPTCTYDVPSLTSRTLPISGTRWHVECPLCLMQGGASPDRDEAVELWNRMPRFLEWTKESPSEIGNYWFRDETCRKPFVVFVAEADGEMVVIGEDGDAYPVSRYGRKSREWAGPLRPPKDGR